MEDGGGVRGRQVAAVTQDVTVDERLTIQQCWVGWEIREKEEEMEEVEEEEGEEGGWRRVL